MLLKSTYRNGSRPYLMKLSVVMITYNHERYIAQAIESALAQKVNFPYEIVIGEDCSTDGTRAVVADFARRYPKQIRALLRTQNLGMNRNLADTLAACGGEYVAYLEGDDYWTSVDKLQRQVDFLDAHPDRVLCCTRVHFLNEAGHAEYGTFPLLPAGAYTIDDLLKTNFIATCSTVLRRELAGPLPPWLFKMKLSDYPLWVMAARHGKIELLDDITASYRVHSGGAWSSLSHIEKHQGYTRMMRALDKELNFEYTRSFTEMTAPPYLQFALEARSQGRRIDVARHLISWARNGGLRLPVNPRLPAGLATYVLIGSGYKMFSRAKSEARS